MKNYKIKKTKNLIKKLKSFWAKFEDIENDYYIAIDKLEKQIASKLDIEDIEIFFMDNEAIGIGNYSRTMELIHREELE